jgi:hypothetical protein
VKTKYAILPACVLAFAALALVFTHTGVLAAPSTMTLKLKLNYMGASTVDEKHRIYVLLFDANPYTAASLADSSSDPAPPAAAPGVAHILARESGAAKNATITFSGLAVSPVYAMCFLDKAGTYNGHLDSVSGAPMGVYGKFPDQLEPIKVEAGKTTQVTMAFDDSLKTP